ncbi:MAG TPA: hypothetical protein VFU22_29855 [Roseiflexaceae bacterium]|nr:hypothetical protein [Roseiflexaceae bacterium]
MEGNGSRRLAWIAIALGGLALFVSLSGRMQPAWGRYHGPQAYQAGPGAQGQFGPQGQFDQRGQFGPQDQFGPQGQFDQRGPLGPREQIEMRRHWGGGPRHGFPFFFLPFMLIGGLFKLLFVGLLIWLGLRLIRGSGPRGPWGRGPGGHGPWNRGDQDPPSKTDPEQPPYTGETQQI